MIATTISLAMHLVLSSYQGVRAVGRVLGYAYSTMAVQGSKIDFNTKHLKTGRTSTYNFMNKKQVRTCVFLSVDVFFFLFCIERRSDSIMK